MNVPPNEPAPTPTDPPPPPTPPSPAAPPPAAKVVIDGKTERELQLERDLETERAGRRKAETDAAHAQDEAKRLRDAQSNPPAPKKKNSGRWTLLHDPND